MLNWLKARPLTYESADGTPETPGNGQVLEYILYRRNLPLIDLALAEHGCSKLILKRVYRRGNTATKVTCCANPSLFLDDTYDHLLLWKIVREGPLPELRAICENSHLESDFYASLVGSWEGDEESTKLAGEPLSSDRFKHVLLYLSGNPRLAISYEASEHRHYWDGLYEFTYNKLFYKCWELAEIVPVDHEWAWLLEKVYRNMYVPYLGTHRNVFDDINAVLERWRVKDEIERSPTFSVRVQIAAECLEPSLGQLSSDDPALRKAFYATFDPSHHEFRDLDWTEWLDRDKYCGTDLSQNKKVWRSENGREKLKSLLWHSSNNSSHSDITDIGFFHARKDEYRKTHPEWFEDKDEELTRKDEELAHTELARKLTADLLKSQATNVLWFLVAGLVGSFFGSLIW